MELTILFTAFVAVCYGFGVYLFASVLPDMRASLSFGYSAAGAMTALAQVGFLVAASQSARWTAKLGAERLVLWSVVACCAGLLGMTVVFTA